MAAIIRTQFIDEMINATGNLQYFLRKDNFETHKEFVNALGIKNLNAASTWYRKKDGLSKDVISKINEYYNLDDEYLFNENGNSQSVFCDDKVVILAKHLNYKTFNKEYETNTFHVDPRVVQPSYSFVMKNDDNEIGIYNKFDNVYFVMEVATRNTGYGLVNGELVLVGKKGNTDINFYWETRKKEKDKTIRWRHTKYIDLSVPFTKTNSLSKSAFKGRFDNIAYVRYAIIDLKNKNSNISNNFENLSANPAYYNYKDCLRCNLSAILKRRQESQYTAFARELGMSETKFRKYLFSKLPPDSELLDKVKMICDINPDTLLHDKNKDFVDIFDQDGFKNGYLYKKISKIDRVGALPIDKSMNLDSAYCFAIENDGEAIKDFTFEGSTMHTYFIVDSRYSLIALENNKTSLEFLYNINEQKMEFKWILRSGKAVKISDDMNFSKNVNEFPLDLFGSQYERVGSVSYCYNYHTFALEKNTTGVKIIK